MVAIGPGPVHLEHHDLPHGWEAFTTGDAGEYFCAPRIYYYCHDLRKTQWQAPSAEDARPVDAGEKLAGRRAYENGDEFIPEPPGHYDDEEYDGPFADSKYVCSCEDPEDIYQPDEDLLDACLECDMEKLKASLEEGANVELENQPWKNTPLHLAQSPPYWDSETITIEQCLRLEITQYLVRQNADIDVENVFHCKAIDLALFHGYQDTVIFLESQGAKLGWFGAAYAGDLVRIKELLDEGVDIDLKGRYDRTAYAEAHLRGQWKVESFLVQQGCCRELPHPEFLRFTAGAAGLHKTTAVQHRERKYRREDNPDWYDDMMEKRFLGYRAKLARAPSE